VEKTVLFVRIELVGKALYLGGKIIFPIFFRVVKKSYPNKIFSTIILKRYYLAKLGYQAP
jgi:hypothetical protein